MALIPYKVRLGEYSGIKENMTIILPDGFELITGGDNDIGRGKYNGLFHWLGCTTSDYFEQHRNWFNGCNISYELFGPLVFITIHDMQFYEDYPYIITAKEFNDKWQFHKYRVARFSENYRMINMVKILFIESEFKIECLEVNNRDYMDSQDLKRLEHHSGIKLGAILNPFKCSIHISDNEICLAYWNQLIHNVISPFGGTIPVKNIDIDKAHNLMKDFYANHQSTPTELIVNSLVDHDNYAEEFNEVYDKVSDLLDFKCL